MGLVKHEDIPKRVFLGVFVLLLVFFMVWSVKNATTEMVCNSGDCPTRFDPGLCLALFVLMTCVSAGISSIAFLISRILVKAVWPNTNF